LFSILVNKWISDLLLTQTIDGQHVFTIYAFIRFVIVMLKRINQSSTMFLVECYSFVCKSSCCQRSLPCRRRSYSFECTSNRRYDYLIRRTDIQRAAYKWSLNFSLTCLMTCIRRFSQLVSLWHRYWFCDPWIVCHVRIFSSSSVFSVKITSRQKDASLNLTIFDEHQNVRQDLLPWKLKINHVNMISTMSVSCCYMKKKQFDWIEQNEW
jgi:hypothetical protein